ncbi:hypothetical protein [Photobacterium damselae]|uniref:hypothetical protein n=1 Tax=Photobacterium damselae TaxID=38293 RepID=UPI001F290204|nr:hypothetical protein [Photobacterium damselae]UKA04762.1 hypothetical protein IHC89_21205 [Photobacterium damselae subsp. damselae]
MSFFSKIANQLTTRKNAKSDNTMARAWDIAKQASKRFNLLPSSLLQFGLSKPSDFFKEALKLAWKEFKKQTDKFTTPTEKSRKANKLLEQILTFAAELSASGVNHQSDEFKLKISNQARYLQADKRSRATQEANVHQMDMFAM